MKAITATLMTLLLLTLSGCAGTENKVDLGLPAGQAATLDTDDDGVPDTLEAELCNRSVATQAMGAAGLGSCNGGNWTPPTGLVEPAFLPTAVLFGADADGDGLPADLFLQGMILRVEPFSAGRASLTAAEPMYVRTIDTDDADANEPVPSVVRVPVSVPLLVTLSPDADGDDLPGAATIHFAFVTVDRRAGPEAVTVSADRNVRLAIDPDDNDAATPVHDKVTARAPRNVWHTGDGDDDAIPGALVIEWSRITIDRTAKATERIALTTETERILLDDDDDRDSWVPLSRVDADGDLVPDATEPYICMVQRQRDPVDGVCVAADGSGWDGSGNNYVAPLQATILLDILDKTEGPMLSLDGKSDDGEDKGAPGVGLMATLAMVAALAGAVRRRL